MRLLIILAASLLPAVAGAQAPPKGEQLIAPVPQGFVLGHEAADDTGVLREFVPAGESVQAWSQMMTVRIFREGGGVSPVAWHNGLVQELLAVCPGATAEEITGGVEQGTEFHLILAGCPESPVTGGEEWFMSKTMAGRDAIYNVQGAWRGPATDALVTGWAAHLRTILVCDTRRPEAPCPAGVGE